MLSNDNKLNNHLIYNVFFVVGTKLLSDLVSYTVVEYYNYTKNKETIMFEISTRTLNIIVLLILLTFFIYFISFNRKKARINHNE